MQRLIENVHADPAAQAPPDRGVLATCTWPARWSASAASERARGSCSSSGRNDGLPADPAGEGGAGVRARAFPRRERIRDHGERVVRGQRLMQSASDIFLGWQRSTAIDGQQRDFYIRQLHDWKGSFDIEKSRPVRGEALRPGLRPDPRPRARAIGRPGGDRGVHRRERPFDRAIADFAYGVRRPERAATTRRSSRRCRPAGCRRCLVCEAARRCHERAGCATRPARASASLRSRGTPAEPCRPARSSGRVSGSVAGRPSSSSCSSMAASISSSVMPLVVDRDADHLGVGERLDQGDLAGGRRHRHRREVAEHARARGMLHDDAVGAATAQDGAELR